MKRLLCFALVASMLLCANGCSGGGTANSDLSSDVAETASPTAREDITEYIESNVPSDLYVLLADEWLTVLVSDGEVDVSVRTTSSFAIPYVAQEVVPIVQAAAEGSDVQLGVLSIQSYQKNNSGVVDGTMSSWRTSDGVKGTFVSEPDGDVLKPNSTIEDLLELYSDYDELVEELRHGTEASHE